MYQRDNGMLLASARVAIRGHAPTSRALLIDEASADVQVRVVH
jgi:hypothetical protein